MPTTTYTLQYDGQAFVLSDGHYEKLRKVYRTGLALVIQVADRIDLQRAD